MACSCSACSASSSIVGEAASSRASDAAVARARGDLICWSRRWAAAVCSLGAARAGEVCLDEGVRYSSIAQYSIYSVAYLIALHFIPGYHLRVGEAAGYYRHARLREEGRGSAGLERDLAGALRKARQAEVVARSALALEPSASTSRKSHCA